MLASNFRRAMLLCYGKRDVAKETVASGTSAGTGWSLTMTGKKTPRHALNVCIVWHMHQPDYRDPISDRTLLPWTWLHALKDYGEMLETVRETGARVVINLVPSLLEQLERYAAGEDRDHWLGLLTQRPAELSDNERQFVVDQFFSVNEATHILPNPRYLELFQLSGKRSDDSAKSFSDQDLRDLQVLFLLAWTGSHLRRKSSVVAGLLHQGRNFSDAQKQELLDCCHAEVGRVLGFHRELEQAGLIEVSVTPYAHPILPLLCDLHTAQKPSPGLPLPAADFRYPQDARLQVREGLKTAARLFGRQRRGMWPAEGAVSEAAIKIMAEEGALWAATDEDILARSLDARLTERSRLYHLYQYAGLPLLFRDRELSDRIGFLYATWDSRDAVADLVQRLKLISAQAPGGTVAIILDGENCWERYPDNGYPFLRDFYQALLQEPEFEMKTVKSMLADSEPIVLDRLAAGSWIRGDFTTWIGHPEENLAWELLHQARQDIFSNQVEEALAAPEEPLGDPLRELLRAEGSDWFWWYGDEHNTAQADIFDRLFRLHLESLYQAGGLPVPDRLQQAIKPLAGKPMGYEPTACFTPRIDGRIGDYFEWLAAGCLDLTVGGAMYASRESLEKLYYGYDQRFLYFRLDRADLLRRLGGEKGMFEIRLRTERFFSLRVDFATGQLSIASAGQGGIAAWDQVLELAVPLAVLQLRSGDIVHLSCHIYKEKRESGRWPAEGSTCFCYRGAALQQENWLV